MTGGEREIKEGETPLAYTSVVDVRGREEASVAVAIIVLTLSLSLSFSLLLLQQHLPPLYLLRPPQMCMLVVFLPPQSLSLLLSLLIEI